MKEKHQEVSPYFRDWHASILGILWGGSWWYPVTSCSLGDLLGIIRMYSWLLGNLSRYRATSMLNLVLCAESAWLEQFWLDLLLSDSSLIFVGGFPSNVIAVWGKFLWKLSKIRKSSHFKAQMALIQQTLLDTKETIVKGWMNIWQVSVSVETWNPLQLLQYKLFG